MDLTEFPLSIGPATPKTAQEGLRLVFSRLGPETSADYVQMLWGGVESGEVSLEGLLEARRGDRLVGAVFAQVQAGSSSVLWPPRIVPQEPPETASQLLAATSTWMAARGVRVAQALMERIDRADDAVLREGGFQPLANLLYLLSEPADFPTQSPEGVLQFRPLSAMSPEAFARLVEATYEGSLDCPGLEGTRSMDDVMASYRSSGVYSPQRWFAVRAEGCDVGCLLLADHPQDNHFELIYMGLVPSARGHGWGKEIVRFAQWKTRQAGRERIVVAVDSANRPAVAMYAAAGFRAWDRRWVYARIFV
jgi:GNAT superfamily N-acetyltransferase